MPEFVEESLDKVAWSIERRIHRALDLPIALFGDMSPPAMGCDEVQDGAGVTVPRGHLNGCFGKAFALTPHEMR
ncbi:hypothetical protein ACFSZS_21430 [Seohaeicola zhoushanensis]